MIAFVGTFLRLCSLLRLSSRASSGPADSSERSAAAASAEERVAAVKLEPRHGDARRHIDLLEDVARLRIDSAQFAFIGFPGAVPEFAVDPGDPGDEAVGLDGAKNRPVWRSI